MSKCNGCKYCTFPCLKQSTDYKLGVDVLIVGDIPVAKEIYAGKVMQGNGRKIIDQALAQVNMPKKVTYEYITAVQCAIPKQKGKTMSKDIMNCRSNLLDLIAYINPKAILLLGKTSYQLWSGNWGAKVSEKYGRIEYIPEFAGMPAMPVYNPGVIVRSPNDYKPFVLMLQKFKDELLGADQYDPGVTTWEVIEEQQMPFFKNWLRHQDIPVGHVIGADIETTGIDYRIADFCVLGLSFEKNKCFVITRECRHHLKEIFDIIQHRKWKLALQHGKFDKKILWRRGLGDIPISEDTMYQHYFLDETTEHNLGYLTKTYLNAAEYKFKMNQEFKAVTLETYDSYLPALIERVAVDADLTRQLNLVLKEEMDKPENKALDTVYRQWALPVANYLARIEQQGVLIDEDYLKEMDVDYLRRLDEVLNQIQKEAQYYWEPEVYKEEMSAATAPREFNPGSPKQMAWLVFEKLKLKPRVKKAMSTAAEVLESIPNPPPVIQLVLKYRGLKKEHSTYVLGLLKRRDIDGCVRANFNLAGTATGRLSCKEPNMQNLPSYFGVGNVRRACIAREGFILAEVDYSGAELRWLAVLSGDENLTNIFVNNINLHDETSRLMYGENFTAQDRMRAKAVNFGELIQ